MLHNADIRCYELTAPHHSCAGAVFFCGTAAHIPMEITRPVPALSQAILRLIAAVAAIVSVMVVMFNDPSGASLWWPADIHRAFVTALGGTVSQQVSGELTASLLWMPLFLRVTVAVAATIVFRSLILHLFAGSASGIPGIAAFAADRLQPALCISLLWLAIWYFAPLLGNPALNQLLSTTSSSLLALLLAMLFCSALTAADSDLCGSHSAAVPEATGRQARLLCLLILLTAAVGWQQTSFWMNQNLYAGLNVPHGDSAMYEEHLWNVWHGKGFRSYLDQGLFLGEHIQLIHLLLLPLHLLLPSYLMMEWVSSACLAACVIPIFRMTLRHSGCPGVALLLALSWLFCFPMHFLDIAIDLKTLRPSCYGLPLLFFGIDLTEVRRLKSAAVCFFIALLTQEDFAIVIGSVGFVFLTLELRRPAAERSALMLRWSAAVGILSVIWVLAAVLLVIPAFRDGEVVHYSRYFGDLGSSPGDLLQTALTAPDRILQILFSQRTLLYLILLTVPTGFLAWKRPLHLSAGLLTFLMLSLIQLDNSSGNEAQSLSGLPPVPYHHFHAPLLPVIFWAAAAATRSSNNSSRPPKSWLRSLARCSERPRFAAGTALLCAVFSAIPGSLFPSGAVFWSETSSFGRNNLYEQHDRGRQLELILREIPESARVASTDYVHTRLTHYERSYDYSGYLRAVNDYQPGVPADTDYIIIDTTHRYSQIRRAEDVPELREQPSQWELLPDSSNGLFLVLKRKH